MARFLGLKSTDWRCKLDEQLRRVGYQLAEFDEENDDEIGVAPMGRGESFVLEVKHLDYLGWHASLYAANESSDEPAEAMAVWRLDESERHPKSCFDVWIDWIVAGVRDAARPL